MDLSIMRLGNRSANKSKLGKAQLYISIFESNQLRIDSNQNVSARLIKNVNFFRLHRKQLGDVIINFISDDYKNTGKNC